MNMYFLLSSFCTSALILYCTYLSSHYFPCQYEIHICQSLFLKLRFLMMLDFHYGSTGCQVFKQGVQNWKDVLLKINIPKGNYCILRIGVMGSCQKVPKCDFQSQFSTARSIKIVPRGGPPFWLMGSLFG